MRILLDTNAYSAFMAGDERVLGALAAADTVYLSVIVLGELHAGFRGGTRERYNRAQLLQFQSKPTVRVLDVTAETAEIFGQCKATLKQAGAPLPLNDVWLAAQALDTGAVVVTYDSHFRKVAGLRLWDGAV
jgi:tRNA(fMet)-specific endonuclease VapC